MNDKTQSRVRIIGGSVAVVAMIALAGCSTGTATTDNTPVDLSPAAQAAAEVVATASLPYDDFVDPGPALGDLSALAGGTVYYVPATLSVPIFNNVAEALSDSLGRADISVVVCDGKANPADVASCLGQAVDAGASAVITHGIPSEMAPVAFDSVTAAGIPLLITQIQPAGPGDPKMVGYLTPNTIEMQTWNTNWIIADSNAAATVLVIKVTDNDATAMWTDVGALAVYEQACPDCTVDVIETNTGQLDKLPSLVSARLVANPDITYVQAPFDLTVQPVVQGIQTAGRDDVQVVSMDGGLSVMQDLAAGKLVSSEVGFDSKALGWYAADQVLRMMTGMESVQNFSFPLRRLFTTESASTLTLTPEAEASGEWYGEADYQAGLLKLWGLD